MSCNPFTDPACVAGNVIKSVTHTAASDALSGIAQSVTDGVTWIVTNTATWWLRVPSPDLAGEPAVAAIHRWLLPVTVAVAVGGVIAAGARMALTRRANPLLDVTGGMLTLAAASTLGVTAATLLLKARDAFSAWVLQASTGGQFAQRLALLLTLGGGAAPAVMLVFGLIAMVMSLAQAVLMLFRQAALIILAGVLPLAAAGSVAPLTRPWVRKITAWMLTLIRTLGGEYRWCAQWWRHDEAVSRLKSLWHAWEVMRLRPGTGMGAWYREHLDHQLPILMGARGPFYQCSETAHREPREAAAVPLPGGRQFPGVYGEDAVLPGSAPTGLTQTPEVPDDLH